MPAHGSTSDPVLIRVWETGYVGPALSGHNISNAGMFLLESRPATWHSQQCWQGTRMVRFGDLSKMWNYRKKQREKIDRLKALARATTSDGTDVSRMPMEERLAPGQSIEMESAQQYVAVGVGKPSLLMHDPVHDT